jgi:hypothetical protein
MQGKTDVILMFHVDDTAAANEVFSLRPFLWSCLCHSSLGVKQEVNYICL